MERALRNARAVGLGRLKNFLIISFYYYYYCYPFSRFLLFLFRFEKIIQEVYGEIKK